MSRIKEVIFRQSQEDIEDSEVQFLRKLVLEQQEVIKNLTISRSPEVHESTESTESTEQNEFQKYKKKKASISRADFRNLRREIQRRADAKLKARAVIDNQGKVHIE